MHNEILKYNESCTPRTVLTTSLLILTSNFNVTIQLQMHIQLRKQNTLYYTDRCLWRNCWHIPLLGIVIHSFKDEVMQRKLGAPCTNGLNPSPLWWISKPPMHYFNHIQPPSITPASRTMQRADCFCSSCDMPWLGCFGFLTWNRSPKP